MFDLRGGHVSDDKATHRPRVQYPTPETARCGPQTRRVGTNLRQLIDVLRRFDEPPRASILHFGRPIGTPFSGVIRKRSDCIPDGSKKRFTNICGQ